MDKVRVGIIGIGNMGSAHAQSIFGGKVPKLELTAICDTAPKRQEWAQEKLPGVKIYDNASDMMKSGDIDAVIVAVPHYEHPSLAIEGFANGLHVLVEKPAGVYTKQVLEMNEAAKKSDKVFCIMYNNRTVPAYQKIRELVQNGTLGKIKRISWIITTWYRPQAYHDSCSWRSTWKDEGGGTLINQNPHQIDLWQWMFGMPSRVMAFGGYGKYRNIEVEDEMTAYMEYDNGTHGTYITSISEAPGTNRLEIACDRGKLVYEKDDQLTFWRTTVSEEEFNRTSTKIFGGPEYWECKIPIDSKGEGHVGILKDFTKSILTGSKLLAPGEEGINGLTISNCMHYSSWTGNWADCKNFDHDGFYNMLQDKIKKSTVVKNVEQRTQGTEGSY